MHARSKDSPVLSKIELRPNDRVGSRLIQSVNAPASTRRNAGVREHGL
jgi:hypothetical protein